MNSFPSANCAALGSMSGVPGCVSVVLIVGGKWRIARADRACRAQELVWVGLLEQLQAGGPLDPESAAVLHMLAQRDRAFRHQCNGTEVLSDAISSRDAMHAVIGGLDQCPAPTVAFHCSYHVQGVQRVGFQRFASSGR